MTDLAQSLSRQALTDAQSRQADQGSSASVLERLRSLLVSFWADHSVFVVVCVAFIGATQIASRAYGYPINLTLYQNITLQSTVLGCTLLIGLFVYVLAWYRPVSPLRTLYQKFIIDWRLPRRVLYGLFGLVASSLFMASFSATKTALPLFVPFYFDDAAAEIDRVMFFGADAWMVLQPLLGHPVITFFINVNYNIWGIITSGTFFAASLMIGRRHLRAQYMVAFCLSWALVGTGLAILLSSVGPCFYEAIYGSDRFAGLMAYLNEANTHYPLWALSTQEMLLFKYENGILGVGSGISAMPSMHLSMTALMTIFAFEINRKLGYLSSVYLVIIFLGSIHLGWHYASDGILSIALAPVIWWMSGKLVGYSFRLSGASGAEAART